MHGNRINNVLKEIKIAKRHLNEAVYTLQQGEHAAADYGVELLKALDTLRDDILAAGTNANPK